MAGKTKFDRLLAIGGRLFREYRKKGGELPAQLLKELEAAVGSAIGSS